MHEVDRRNNLKKKQVRYLTDTYVYGASIKYVRFTKRFLVYPSKILLTTPYRCKVYDVSSRS